MVNDGSVKRYSKWQIRPLYILADFVLTMFLLNLVLGTKQLLQTAA